MRLGLSIAEPGTTITLARTAEELGFDYLACGEHIFFHGVAPNPYVQLAAAAAATTKIRLASTLSLLPLYPAVMVAKLAATLDHISSGRFELGVGAGGEYEAEFAAAGVGLASRFRRLDEGLEILQLLFSGQSVSFEGEFARLRNLSLMPPPLQPGGPPLWIGGRREGAIRRAGRFAHTWVPYMMTPDRYEKSLRQVRIAAREVGRSETVRGAIFIFICVDYDRAWATRIAVETVSAMYREDFGPKADHYFIVGTPDRAVERLREYADGGLELALLHIAADGEDRERVMTTLAVDVLPRLRSL